MSSVNIEVLQQVIAEQFTIGIHSCFGNSGIDALKDLFFGIRQIYKHVDPTCITARLVILRSLTNITTLPDNFIMIHNLENIHAQLVFPCVLQLNDNNTWTLWNNFLADPEKYSSNALVYCYENGCEKIFYGNDSKTIPPIYDAQTSIFAVPMFDKLNESLEDYKTKMAKHSTCSILNTIWSDPKRIFLINKPESTMRRSLTNHLMSTLRNTEVRPEQNVDESHPVDIKVTWMYTNRRAIIEIKWLGKSKNTDGTDATSYSESRARDGASQLANYLDEDKKFAPTMLTKGYLIVYDARRRCKAEPIENIKPEQALFYEDKELTFDPQYHHIRSDFEPPVRFYLRPRA